MPIKSRSVIIDTNLWVSFLLSDKYIKLDKLILSHHITLIFSQELLEEFFDVISRPKFKNVFSKELLQKVIGLIKNHSELIEVKSVVSVCRDPNDNFLLALASDSQANFLITGDNDLLDIKEFGATRILNYSEFLKVV